MMEPAPVQTPTRSYGVIVVVVVVGVIVGLGVFGAMRLLRAAHDTDAPQTPAPQRPVIIEAPLDAGESCDMPREGESMPAFEARCPSSSAPRR